MTTQTPSALSSPKESVIARQPALRITLKFLAAAVLILILILFTSSEVDFVYTGF